MYISINNLVLHWIHSPLITSRLNIIHSMINATLRCQCWSIMMDLAVLLLYFRSSLAGEVGLCLFLSHTANCSWVSCDYKQLSAWPLTLYLSSLLTLYPSALLILYQSLPLTCAHLHLWPCTHLHMPLSYRIWGITFPFSHGWWDFKLT